MHREFSWKNQCLRSLSTAISITAPTMIRYSVLTMLKARQPSPRQGWAIPSVNDLRKAPRKRRLAPEVERNLIVAPKPVTTRRCAG